MSKPAAPSSAAKSMTNPSPCANRLPTRPCCCLHVDKADGYETRKCAPASPPRPPPACPARVGCPLVPWMVVCMLDQPGCCTPPALVPNVSLPAVPALLRYEEAVWAWVEFEDVRDPQEATMMVTVDGRSHFTKSMHLPARGVPTGWPVQLGMACPGSSSAVSAGGHAIHALARPPQAHVPQPCSSSSPRLLVCCCRASLSCSTILLATTQRVSPPSSLPACPGMRLRKLARNRDAKLSTPLARNFSGCNGRLASTARRLHNSLCCPCPAQASRLRWAPRWHVTSLCTRGRAPAACPPPWAE